MAKEEEQRSSKDVQLYRSRSWAEVMYTVASPQCHWTAADTRKGNALLFSKGCGHLPRSVPKSNIWLETRKSLNNQGRDWINQLTKKGWWNMNYQESITGLIHILLISRFYTGSVFSKFFTSLVNMGSNDCEFYSAFILVSSSLPLECEVNHILIIPLVTHISTPRNSL